jgi:hypothetical protein
MAFFTRADMIASPTPPRWTEKLLTSLGAQPSYRDAVLGDLTEEFVIRAEEQGVIAARRWYRREALRAAPHLLGNWARSLTPRASLRLCFATIVAGVVHRLLGMAIPLVIVMSLGVKPDSWGVVAAAWRDVLMDTSGLKWTGLILLRLVPIGAGFLAASLNPRGRIPAALTLAALDAAVVVCAFAIAPDHSIVAAFVPAPLALLGSILLGGVLRVLAGSRVSVAAK